MSSLEEEVVKEVQKQMGRDEIVRFHRIGECDGRVVQKHFSLLEIRNWK